jgi:hypothetical protein
MQTSWTDRILSPIIVITIELTVKVKLILNEYGFNIFLELQYTDERGYNMKWV